MNRQQFWVIIPTLLIVLGLPWIAHSQSGGGGLGVGGRGSSSSSGGSSGEGNGSGGGLGSGGMGGMGGGGMGGMGGGGMGGMGGGGMGGMGGGLMGGGGMAFEPTIYQRPEGPPPTWLLSGLASVKATEDLRRLLNERIDIDEPHADFNVSMDYLRHKGIDVEVDSKTLENDGIDIESVKGLSVSNGTIRELLMRVLDAQELTYRVLENHIQITSQNRAQEIPTICYYDLSFVQTNSNRLMEIINAIETSIEPDSWVNNGGVSSIVPLGQILVVSSTESAHQEIERLLARLSQTLAESSPKRQASNKTNENNVRSSQPAGENPFGSPAKSASEDPFGGNSKSANDDPFR